MPSSSSTDATVLRWSRYHLQKLLMLELLSLRGSWPFPSSVYQMLCAPSHLGTYILTHKCLLRLLCARSYTETDAVRVSLTAWWAQCMPGQGSRGLCGHSAGSQRGWEAGHQARSDNPVSTYKTQTSGRVSQRGTQWERVCVTAVTEEISLQQVQKVSREFGPWEVWGDDTSILPFIISTCPLYQPYWEGHYTYPL